MLYSSAYSDTVDGCELHFAPLRSPMVPPENTHKHWLLTVSWAGVGWSPNWEVSKLGLALEFCSLDTAEGSEGGCSFRW